MKTPSKLPTILHLLVRTTTAGEESATRRVIRATDLQKYCDFRDVGGPDWYSPGTLANDEQVVCLEWPDVRKVDPSVHLINPHKSAAEHLAMYASGTAHRRTVDSLYADMPELPKLLESLRFVLSWLEQTPEDFLAGIMADGRFHGEDGQSSVTYALSLIQEEMKAEGRKRRLA